MKLFSLALTAALGLGAIATPASAQAFGPQCLPYGYSGWSQHCYFQQYGCYGHYCPQYSSWYYWYPQQRCYLPCSYMRQYPPRNVNVNNNTNVNTNININGSPVGGVPVPVGPVADGPVGGPPIGGAAVGGPPVGGPAIGGGAPFGRCGADPRRGAGYHDRSAPQPVV